MRLDPGGERVAPIWAGRMAMVQRLDIETAAGDRPERKTDRLAP